MPDPVDGHGVCAPALGEQLQQMLNELLVARLFFHIEILLVKRCHHNAFTGSVPLRQEIRRKIPSFELGSSFRIGGFDSEASDSGEQ